MSLPQSRSGNRRAFTWRCISWTFDEEAAASSACRQFEALPPDAERECKLDLVHAFFFFFFFPPPPRAQGKSSKDSYSVC